MIMASPLEPDIIALTLADTLQALQETRLILSCSLEVAATLTAENRRLQDRVSVLLEERREIARHEAERITPAVMFSRR
jgi:hypothetical protein